MDNIIQVVVSFITIKIPAGFLRNSA